jgi:hypothetical protein
VSTSISNPAIPGNITAAYYLFGPDIGSGNFQISEGILGGAYGNLQIETVAATPLPAALPLFATGLGVIGLFGWRKKRKLAQISN